ncbi:MAG: arylamine N-acetyltransferase, partial [candidate division KSB1 bacterium]|nr:arylamine N-acetyltransferase [candidate division KSB1 bacterium]
GDSFREPLRLDDFGGQLYNGSAYRLLCDGTQWIMLRQQLGSDWEPKYLFTLQPHSLADFAGMCYYHQTSPQSHFTRKRICSRATPEGRVTLSDMRLITTSNGERQERILSNQEEFAAALRDHFGFDLDDAASI